LTHDIGVIGAAGRLGSVVCVLAAERGFPLTLFGRRQGWEVRAVPRVLIDVSHPSALPDVLAYCQREGTALVEGVSGLGSEERGALRRLARRVPVVEAANFAFGAFLHRALVDCLAGLVAGLPEADDFAILDRHPATKKDRPSATARDLAGLWAARTGRPPPEVASVRAGLPVADHEATLTLAGELVSVRHSVTDRRAAARGALAAASWVCRQPPGLYSMRDVYGRRPKSP
jgi:4-hydroxy-tetrahydrodipicolinate reductase